MTFSRIVAGVAAGFVLSVTSALAQPPQGDSGYRSKSMKRDSIYHSYGSRAFVRGGYIFADDSDLLDFTAPYGSIGYRRKFNRSGNSIFSVEGEVLALRNRDSATALGLTITNTNWLVTGLIGVRWDGFVDAPVSPFLSIAGGPGYVRTAVDVNGVSANTDEFSFAYTGRGGFQVNVKENLGVELGYRHLDYTLDGFPAMHAAEIGFNLAM